MGKNLKLQVLSAYFGPLGSLNMKVGLAFEWLYMIKKLHVAFVLL